MSADASDDEFTEEEWVYLGPHPTMAASYRWRDGNGEILTYGKLRARVFGAVYRVDVLRGANDSVRVRRETTWAGRMAEDAATIEAQALRVEAHLKLKRLEVNTSRTATIDEAIAPLLELAGSIKSPSDRRALLDYITARVYAVKSA